VAEIECTLTYSCSNQGTEMVLTGDTCPSGKVCAGPPVLSLSGKPKCNAGDQDKYQSYCRAAGTQMCYFDYSTAIISGLASATCNTGTSSCTWNCTPTSTPVASDWAGDSCNYYAASPCTRGAYPTLPLEIITGDYGASGCTSDAQAFQWCTNHQPLDCDGSHVMQSFSCVPNFQPIIGEE
jgi:hypothetical protein